MSFNFFQLLPLVICVILETLAQGFPSDSRIVCSRISSDGSIPLKVWLRRQRQKLFNPQAEIKRPSFHPWAGKRSDENKEDEKRAGFHAWGGKRVTSFIDGNDESSKRAFSAWGGKRNLVENEQLTNRGYHAWGGKRTLDTKEEDFLRKRGFHAWGGKRSSGFHAWGGKRSPALSTFGYKRQEVPNKNSNVSSKRAFNPWGGKRQEVPNENDGYKRAFSAWGGKRGNSDDVSKREFNAWGGKRQDDSFLSNKRTFGAWGGKRQDISLSNEDEKRQFSALAKNKQTEDGGDSDKRGFHAWGGKRDTNTNDKFNILKSDILRKIDNLESLPSWSDENLDDSKQVKRSNYDPEHSKTDDSAIQEKVDVKTREFNAWGGR